MTLQNITNTIDKEKILTPSMKVTTPKKFRNIIKASYNFRFIKPKTRILYFKTIKQQERYFGENVEFLYENYIENNIFKVERREKNKRFRTGIFTSIVPMAFRALTFTRVFITHCVKNTFVTIYRGVKDDVINKYKLQVAGKFSCGLLGYKGPKKSTVFARKEVIKESGLFLAGLLTTLMTVVFTSKVNRWNRKSVRNLAPDLAYIVNIITKRQRSHGKQKYKNRRRT
jgi:hypothetical protein